MKIFLILIIVFFYQSNSVNCGNFFSSVSTKFNDLTNTVKSALVSFKNKVKSFIFPESTKVKYMKMLDIEPTLKINKAFCDFVETEAASDTESSEYNNMRSEPTALMSTTQLVALHGKRVESHVVVTKDGYLLTLHRLRHPFLVNDNKSNNMGNFTVLLHHGLLGSSADWILLGAEKSLPYILLNEGCDVWLANSRGNYYSRGHISKNVNSLDFWDFSFQEMGEYDLPAVIDYIKKVKNNSVQINFIGHSMGATAFLVMLSTYPDYNKYFRMGILLAPLVYMTNTEGPLKVLTSMANSPPEQLLKMLGGGEFVPNRKIPVWFANKYCKGPDLYCQNPLLFLSGILPAENFWDKSLIARILYHIPAGGSTNTILHFSQMVKSAKFHKFNNEQDEFQLRHVKVPIVIFSSNDDSLATISDILRLYFSIENPIDHFVIRGKKVTHTDFLWSPEADYLIYDKILDFLINGLKINASQVNLV